MKENKKGKSTSEFSEMPLGLSSALARNVSAMQVFAELPDGKRQEIIEGAKAMHSKEEMRAYVASLTRNEK